MIRAIGLSKTYVNGEIETPVLRDLSFEIKDGEFVSIMGRSGEGKSTLLYQIALLDTPTSGQVFLNNRETSELNQLQRSRIRLKELGFVFQDYALLPELTAAENIAAPLLMQGISLSQARKMAIETLASVNMEHRADNVPSKLSGGEKQRVSVARAIAHKPAILFADEPTASLDEENAHQVLRIFSQLNKAGQTIVMVTHEKEFAQYSERILELKNGEILSKKVTNRVRVR